MLMRHTVSSDDDEGDAQFHVEQPDDREDDPAHRRDALLQFHHRHDEALEGRIGRGRHAQQQRQQEGAQQCDEDAQVGRADGAEGVPREQQIQCARRDLLQRREEHRHRADRPDLPQHQHQADRECAFPMQAAHPGLRA
jgi:hypothetical protein